ncbi:MAG TPA: nuclear transport factor 2 family protein [Candidatus Sulfotelmatobacter sp.]|nr:nuclear transport factor 2 family protein [Candidatus Sulfotelmatobacter sp.]
MERSARTQIARFLAALIALLLISSGTWAQKKQKNKPPDDNTPMPAIPLPVADQIDNDIGEMLGAFQVGNIEVMHKHYAENATWVRGTYEPLLVGWPNYLAVYQQQRANFQGMQLIRRNTTIFNHGDMAWAAYQWEFLSVVEGKPFNARGHTTLVLMKVGDNWLIVHNHTSQICQATPWQPLQQPGLQAQPPGQAPPSTAPPKP